MYIFVFLLVVISKAIGDKIGTILVVDEHFKVDTSQSMALILFKLDLNASLVDDIELVVGKRLSNVWIM
jgi:hypothetical protein